MKKSFVLMMVGSLLVGCTSSNNKNDSKSAKPAGLAIAIKDNDTKSKDNQKKKIIQKKKRKNNRRRSKKCAC